MGEIEQWSIKKMKRDRGYKIYTRLSPQQGDLRLSGLPSDQGACGGARTCDKRVPADFSTDLLATGPPTPLAREGNAWCDARETREQEREKVSDEGE
ncbi:hypothetical protein PoB_005622500 [Plakobranchus ocellatus]|uniref:Uncharacterized protein n=1 Tax=Plakobranchus ocellatus TaxID=259542 RepID=A0AAV4CDI0_9GAST|nr:hypothetical protein PoB_005622500 [Plakobranchus ocellatus]